MKRAVLTQLKSPFWLADPLFLKVTIAIASFILFTYSTVRHLILRSSAYDLGLFDSAIYRWSRGEVPLDTLHNIHILGDHAAWIFYPISWLYKLYPTVYWLFGLQALGLSLAILPLWSLARQKYGLSPARSRLMVWVYLLYPVVFNANLFDFHPDVFSPFLLLTAILSATTQNQWGFLLALILLCGCKAVFGLTIMALGTWLCLGEKKYRYGAIAILIGLIWFIIAARVIIPGVSGAEVTGVERYEFLGDSVEEIILHLFLSPQLVLTKIFTFANLRYLCLLLLPCAWGLSWRDGLPMIGALPTILLNVLSNFELQKDLNHHYSLPILPFLLLMVMSSLAHKRTWLIKPKYIFLWSLIGFLSLGKVTYFAVRYYDEGLRTVGASRAALTLIADEGSILAPSHIVPQVTHRLAKVTLLVGGSETSDLGAYHYIFLDTDYPGAFNSVESVQQLRDRLQRDRDFSLIFNRNQVYLFARR